LISIAGCIKGAQFFTHVWLPDAMEAPTPASALIHSSTLVIMGIYVIIRFSIMFEFCYLINFILALWGGFTIAYGSITASFQDDVKKLVAYSTISQMGYLVCGCGFSAYEETVVYLLMHAVNKAFLFLLVGYSVHFFSSNTDFRQIGSTYVYTTDLCLLFLTIGINLMGLPFTSGFFSKEFLLFQILRDDILSVVVRSCWVVSFFFTPYYMVKLTFYVVLGPNKSLKFLLNSIIRSNFLLLLTIVIKKILVPLFKHNLFLSRVTATLLLTLLALVCFYGEDVFLLIFCFMGLSDVLNSFFFIMVKSHYSMLLVNESFNVIEAVTFFIIIVTTNSLLLTMFYKKSPSQLSILNFKLYSNSYILLVFMCLAKIILY